MTFGIRIAGFNAALHECYARFFTPPTSATTCERREYNIWVADESIEDYALHLPQYVNGHLGPLPILQS